MVIAETAQQFRRKFDFFLKNFFLDQDFWMYTKIKAVKGRVFCDEIVLLEKIFGPGFFCFLFFSNIAKPIKF